MASIKNSIQVTLPYDLSYNKLQNIEFEKIMNPQAEITVLFENNRLIKYQIGCGDDKTFFDKVFIPEKHTIFSNRIPKPPFLYTYFFYLFEVEQDFMTITYSQDFELLPEYSDQESQMISFLQNSGITVLEKLKSYLSEQ